jgi:hypothetical protein
MAPGRRSGHGEAGTRTRIDRRKSASLRRWIPLVEETTLCRTSGDVVNASRVYDALPRDEQLNVARELVTTRAAELCRAYRNVIDVSFGYRRRRARAGGPPQIVPIPCVRFLVKRKWRHGQGVAGQMLPRRLFAYCSVSGRRALCAIPTDVEDARVFRGIEAGALLPVEAKWRESVAGGVLTCALRRRGVDGTYALCCRHVLSLTDLFHPHPTWGASVRAIEDQGAALLGRTRAVAGPLFEAPEPSFDAQLLEVTDAERLRRALGGLRLDGHARGLGDLPDVRFIVTPHGTIEATQLEFIFDRPLYRLGGVGWVSHRQLVVSVLAEPTRRGDSGSPVVSRRDGGLLLGMHIAGVDNGSGARFAYMIPAWELLNPVNYDGAANREEWEPVNPPVSRARGRPVLARRAKRPATRRRRPATRRRRSTTRSRARRLQARRSRPRRARRSG